MPKNGQGSFSSKRCHDNYWYYVHPKNGMASLDMSAFMYQEAAAVAMYQEAEFPGNYQFQLGNKLFTPSNWYQEASFLVLH